jgi:succinate-acetate transporter protein
MSELETTTPPSTPLANPAPLGLCGFALTTFVLSAINSKLLGGENVLNIVVGIAFFYGGLAQLLAGMWEIKTGNTFGATAFTSYGAFWIAVGSMIKFNLIPSKTAFAWFLLAWTIFTAMLFICTFSLNTVLKLLFGLLLATFALLTLGEFGISETLGQVGGFFGFATAFVAWYAALAALLVSVKSKITLPT